jgi:hypothetical protein
MQPQLTSLHVKMIQKRFFRLIIPHTVVFFATARELREQWIFFP